MAQATEATALQEGAEPEQEQIAVRSWVDRTALFPGDRVNYNIEIQVDTNMGILLDDLEADELGLTGLEIVSSTIDEEALDGRTHYHGSYLLTTYETGIPSLEIDELTIRYYFRRPGQRLEDVATAGEVIVPAVSLALQSTLPSDPASLGLRDMGSPWQLQGLMRGAGTWGLIVLFVSLIPVVIFVRTRLAQSKIQQPGHKHEEMLQETTDELIKLKKLDPQRPEQRLAGFTQLEHIIKEFIERNSGINATALTSAEISMRISAEETPIPVTDLVAVLEVCETARFGKSDDLPSVDRFNTGLTVVQGLLSS